MTLSPIPSNSSGGRIRKQILLGWVFVLFWAIFVVGFDAHFAWSAAQQIRAGQTWRRSTATVLTSEVVTSRGSRGRTVFRPSITYSYSADGREFTGSQVEAFGTGGSGRARAERATKACRVGAVVPVYIDPANPARAALRVGLQPETIEMFMLSLPFNAVLIGVTVFLFRARGYADDPMLGRVVREDEQRAVLRTAQWSPTTAGCLLLGVTSFVGILLAMIWFGGDPPINVTVAVVIGSFLSGLFAFLWRSSAIAAGRYDIEVDRVLKRVTLPRQSGWWRLERPSLPFDAIEVVIERDEDRKINRAPAWKLHLRAADSPEAYTAFWLSRADARRLGDWIARRCGAKLEVIGPAESNEDD